jgi:hypothetical protein
MMNCKFMYNLYFDGCDLHRQRFHYFFLIRQYEVFHTDQLQHIVNENTSSKPSGTLSCMPDIHVFRQQYLRLLQFTSLCRLCPELKKLFPYIPPVNLGLVQRQNNMSHSRRNVMRFVAPVVPWSRQECSK